MFKKIYIEITNLCNLNCSFCSNSIKEKRSMKLDEFENILKKIKGYTKTIYLHVKGEPLLHKNIIAILKLCEDYNISVNMTTNGVLFPKLAKDLASCKALRKINFSLHSENNIENYCEKIFDNIKYLSTDTIVIYRLWTLNNGCFDEKSTNIVEKMIKEYELNNTIVKKLYQENNVKISSTIYVDKDNKFEWPKLTNIKNNGYCYALKTHLAILVDGTVVPCCLDAEGMINLGNIYEQNLLEIINSERYQSIKKSFQDRKPCEKLCQSCTFKRI